ncbi:MAG: hypothetical protein WC325_10320 [Candidatus Bathyarchaeia archaeon]|jgi:uncharacterized Zn finger protein
MAIELRPSYYCPECGAKQTYKFTKTNPQTAITRLECTVCGTVFTIQRRMRVSVFANPT